MNNEDELRNDEPVREETFRDDLPPPHSDEPLTTSEISSEDRMLAMFCHLGGILTGFIAPLIIWLVKKDQSPFVDDQGKEALNFQLTLLIAYAVGGATACFFVGFFIIIGAAIAATVLGIMAGIAANNGERYRYPWTIRFIK